MKILFVEADTPQELNSSIWLCRIPANALRRAGHETHMAPRQAFAAGQVDELCEQADVIVYERWVSGREGQKIVEWLERGKPIIVRFDDAYHLMPTDSITAPKWRQSYKGVRVKHDALGRETRELVRYDTPVLRRFREILGKVSGYSTPSHLLLQDYAACNSSRFFIPNYPDLQSPVMWESPHARHVGKSPIIIGWGGSSQHLQSWRHSDIEPALARLEEDHPVVYVLVEGAPYIVNQLRLRRLYWSPYVPFELWPREIAKWDIAVIPLAGEYDQRRSWIKPLEASLMRVPWVATDAPPYEEAQGGIKVRNRARDWYAALVELVHDAERREELALEGWGWAVRQDINLHTGEYIGMFEEVT